MSESALAGVQAQYSEEFSYARGQPLVAAQCKQSCEDFVVVEELGFEPEGKGEHVFVQIQKRNQNTMEIVRRLASSAQVKPQDIGFSGLKDRHAVTTQWFSIYLPGVQNSDWSQLQDSGLEGRDVQILQLTRHPRKLRRGVHKSNSFEIVLCDMQLSEVALNNQNGCLRNNTAGRNAACLDMVAEVEQRLQQLTEGVPNYFGEQRFGWHRSNISKAQAMFNGQLKVNKRDKRGIYLSAARAYLFNRLLCKRVELDSWSNNPLMGDVLMLDGSASIFCPDSYDEEIEQRLQAHDVHLTGPLWGRGGCLAKQESAALEQSLINGFSDLTQGLELAGLKYQRRALRVVPQRLTWQWQDQNKRYLKIKFSLPSGCFATSVLRECVNLVESSDRSPNNGHLDDNKQQSVINSE